MISRRAGLGLAGGAVAAALFGGAGQAAAASAWPERIGDAARAAVKAGTVAGIAIAVGEGDRSFAAAAGSANLETLAPAAPDSVFRIASITKTFTAAAILLLRDRGRLRLDQALADFYPAIPGSRAITLRHLLSHISGLHDFARGGLPPDVGRDWETAEAFAAGVARMEPLQDFAPGTRYSYSNTGYVLLGGIIEQVSGLSYERFLADNLFAPCGLARTAVDHGWEVVPGRADGYSLADGKPGAFRHPDLRRLPFAAGAIRSTAPDLVRWARCFFGGRILSPGTVAEMVAPARVASGARVGDARWWPSGFDPGKPPSFATDDHYGMGWELTTFFGRPTINHSGGIAGYNAMLVHYPDEDLSLALVGNTENGIVAPLTDLLRAAGAQKPGS